MSAKPDGGPAFPNGPLPQRTDEAQYGQSGMTLRDWLAAHAPPRPANWYGQMAQMQDHSGLGFGQIGSTTSQTEAIIDSAWRYAHADAMLSERAKP